MFIPAILLIESLLLAAILLSRRPKLLVPAVVALLPVEFAGALLYEQGAELVGSLANPGKLLMAATVLVVAYRERHDLSRLFPSSRLVVPLLALLVVMVLAVTWSDRLVPPNAVVILPLYVAFVFAAPALIEDRCDVERILGAFLLATIVLALLAIGQRGGVFTWREALVRADGTGYRSNATFADPNILARFLAISLALAGGLVLVTGPRRLTLYLAVPAIGLGSLAIIATASRSGWLMLVLCAAVVIVMAPADRWTKVKLTAGGAVALGGLLGFLLVQGGEYAQRVATLTDATELLGARQGLIRAGWAMFLDNPVVGVGAGNFQRSLLFNYLDLVPLWQLATLSHTSVITVLSEMGIVGAALFGLVGIRIAVAMGSAYTRARSPWSRLVCAWLVAAVLGVFLHSQSEGRLVEEPFLWVLLALVVAVETRPLLLAGATADTGSEADRAALAA
ncbi:MAG: hypothetical protein Kow0010_25280 [Dehalococcoidia bacterium]